MEDKIIQFQLQLYHRYDAVFFFILITNNPEIQKNGVALFMTLADALLKEKMGV